MSLRTRTLWLVSLILVGSAVVLYLLTRAVLIASFNDLERRDTHEHVRRVQAALADEMEQLRSAAGDWGPWTDTYEFVQGEHPDYIETNLVDATFVNLRVSFMIFVDSSANIVYAKYYDWQNRVEKPIPPELRTWIALDNPHLQHTVNDEVKTGILLLPDAPLLVAIQSITTSDTQQPPIGTLIVANYLDANKLAALNAKVQIKFTAVSLNQLPALAHDRQAFEQLSGETNVLIQPLDTGIIAGYFLRNDLDGHPAVLMRVDRERSIYARGQDTLRYLMASIGAVGLVFGTASWIMLERSILRRMATIAGCVTQIGRSGDRSARLPVLPGQDELSQLTVTINGMLAALERSETELEQRNLLLKEIHHRVKNNLQVVSSLLTLQQHQCDDLAVKQLLTEGQNRIQIIALVHERLYNSANPSQIELGEYIHNLVNKLENTVKSNQNVQVQVNTVPVVLNADRAVPVGLILNELITNAFKHAFPGERAGMITVEMRITGEKQVQIVVHDTGMGLPVGFDFQQAQTLGLRLVNGLVRQLKGTLELRSDSGTTFVIGFGEKE